MKEDILSIKDKVIKTLCEKKLLVENDIKKALELQKQKGGTLSDILIGMGLVSRNNLISVLTSFRFTEERYRPRKLRSLTNRQQSGVVAEFSLVPISS